MPEKRLRREICSRTSRGEWRMQDLHCYKSFGGFRCMWLMTLTVYPYRCSNQKSCNHYCKADVTQNILWTQKSGGFVVFIVIFSDSFNAFFMRIIQCCGSAFLKSSQIRIQEVKKPRKCTGSWGEYRTGRSNVRILL